MKIRFYWVFLVALTLFGWRAESQIYDTNNVVVQTFVGSGFYGYYDGQGVQTMFNFPSQVVADSHSNLFVLDNANNAIRKVTPVGTVSTFTNNYLLGYGYVLGGMAIDHSNKLWIAVNSGSQYGVSIFTLNTAVTNGNAENRGGTPTQSSKQPLSW